MTDGEAIMCQEHVVALLEQIQVCDSRVGEVEPCDSYWAAARVIEKPKV